ncbi:MAG TPA: hypothetical protein VEA81_11270, partial [Burkholderiaceae bacterium]|nr:hypothetical protein [Burkholderiaceae bacterium]
MHVLPWVRVVPLMRVVRGVRVPQAVSRMLGMRVRGPRRAVRRALPRNVRLATVHGTEPGPHVPRVVPVGGPVRPLRRAGRRRD